MGFIKIDGDHLADWQLNDIVLILQIIYIIKWTFVYFIFSSNNVSKRELKRGRNVRNWRMFGRYNESQEPGVTDC